MIGVLRVPGIINKPVIEWLKYHNIPYKRITSPDDDLTQFDRFILPGYKLGEPYEIYWNRARPILDYAKKNNIPVLGICEGLHAIVRWILGRPVKKSEYWILTEPTFYYKGQYHNHVMAYYPGLFKGRAIEITDGLPFINVIKYGRWIGVAHHPEKSTNQKLLEDFVK